MQREQWLVQLIAQAHWWIELPERLGRLWHQLGAKLWLLTQEQQEEFQLVLPPNLTLQAQESDLEELALVLAWTCWAQLHAQLPEGVRQALLDQPGIQSWSPFVQWMRQELAGILQEQLPVRLVQLEDFRKYLQEKLVELRREQRQFFPQVESQPEWTREQQTLPELEAPGLPSEVLPAPLVDFVRSLQGLEPQQARREPPVERLPEQDWPAQSEFRKQSQVELQRRFQQQPTHAQPAELRESDHEP